jgi:hypothetical protein
MPAGGASAASAKGDMAIAAASATRRHRARSPLDTHAFGVSK